MAVEQPGEFADAMARIGDRPRYRLLVDRPAKTRGDNAVECDGARDLWHHVPVGDPHYLVHPRHGARVRRLQPRLRNDGIDIAQDRLRLVEHPAIVLERW